MPIRFTWAKLPVDENGKSYDSLEAFQVAAIARLLQSNSTVETAGVTPEAIVEHKAEIIEILELTTDARPTARGVRKPRKAKVAPAQSDLPKIAVGAA